MEGGSGEDDVPGVPNALLLLVWERGERRGAPSIEDAPGSGTVSGLEEGMDGVESTGDGREGSEVPDDSLLAAVEVVEEEKELLVDAGLCGSSLHIRNSTSSFSSPGWVLGSPLVLSMGSILCVVPCWYSF